MEEGLARFKMKAEREAAEGASYAAQIYAEPAAADRPREGGLGRGKAMLANEDERSLMCPSVTELAKRLNDFSPWPRSQSRGRTRWASYAGLIAGSGLTRSRRSESDHQFFPVARQSAGMESSPVARATTPPTMAALESMSPPPRIAFTTAAW